MPYPQSSRRALPSLSLAPPNGARATTFEHDGEQFLVLSYPRPAMRRPAELTTAEQDVALAFVTGSSMAEIAQRRGTSKNTVANQLRAIYGKLGVDSRLALARRIMGG